MMAQSPKTISRLQRKLRVRARVQGTPERPRLTMHVSNRHVSAQIIDDERGVTVAASDSRKGGKGNLTEQATWVGSDIAAQAKKAKVERVVFDRNGRKYHGRLKALADKARQSGLEF
jgi:large subunit ribosomal protein L18